MGIPQRAAVFTPNYPVLEINLGIACGGLGRSAEAESHFLRAITLAPQRSQGYYFYGRWLHDQGRSAQALQMLQSAVRLNAADFDARGLLLALYAERGDWPALKQAAEEGLALVPADAKAQAYLAQALAQQGAPKR